MKNKFEVKFSWKQITLLAFFTTFFYALILYSFNIDENLKSIAVQAIIYGVFMTLFFVFLFPWFMKKLVGNRIDNIKPILLENEKVEEEIFANLFRGIEGVGGKIFLTKERLIFKSHSLNIQKGQTNIKYSQIAAVEKRKTMKTVDNGIKIITKENKEYCFIVNDRDTQIQIIQKRIS